MSETMRELASLIKEHGYDAVRKEIVEAASLEDRVLEAGIDAAARIKAAAETTRPAPPPKMSKAALAAFKAHAAKHQWNPESGVAPSAHIKTKFKKWLGRGLKLKDVHDAQENLAGAYSKEVSRDPSKRIKGLYVRPHKLPAGTPRPLALRLVSELSEEEKAQKRANDAARKRRQRLNQRSSTVGHVTP